MIVTNKRLLISESCGDLNWCTSYRGKPDQHDTYVLHVRPVYASWGRSPYMTTFHTDPIELDIFTAPEKKYSWLHLSAQLSGPWDPPQLISQRSHWSGVLKPNSCRQQATRLIGPISPAYDRYVQYLLMGANPSVLNLNRQRRGYNLAGAGLPIPLRLSQPTVLHFSPSGPAQSQFINY
jgi:hypothetical protein